MVILNQLLFGILSSGEGKNIYESVIHYVTEIHYVYSPEINSCKIMYCNKYTTRYSYIVVILIGYNCYAEQAGLVIY